MRNLFLSLALASLVIACNTGPPRGENLSAITQTDQSITEQSITASMAAPSGVDLILVDQISNTKGSGEKLENFSGTNHSAWSAVQRKPRRMYATITDLRHWRVGARDHAVLCNTALRNHYADAGL